MDNLLLKTMILIMEDKVTGKPVVVSSFHGFETEEEAIAILKARVSDDRQIPEANINVHVIYDEGEK